MADQIEDQPADQGLGFLIPVGLRLRRGRQRLAPRPGWRRLRPIDAGRVESGQGIEAGGRLAGDAEGIEDMDWPKPGAGARGDRGIFALGIDADHRAVGQ